jgi:hypothetical protein
LKSINLDPFENNRELKKIHLSGNQLSNITLNTNNLTVEDLDLSDNNVCSGLKFWKLQTIKTLDLSKNPLLDLTTIEFQPTLTSLSLNEMNFKDINKVWSLLKPLKMLTVLNLNRNLIEHLDLTSCPKLENLQKLSFLDNHLSKIEYTQIKTHFPKLTTLNVDRNRWECSYLTLMKLKLNEQNISINMNDGQQQANENLPGNVAGIKCFDYDENENGKTIPIIGSLNLLLVGVVCISILLLIMTMVYIFKTKKYDHHNRRKSSDTYVSSDFVHFKGDSNINSLIYDTLTLPTTDPAYVNCASTTTPASTIMDEPGYSEPFTQTNDLHIENNDMKKNGLYAEPFEANATAVVSYESDDDEVKIDAHPIESDYAEPFKVINVIVEDPYVQM